MAGAGAKLKRKLKRCRLPYGDDTDLSYPENTEPTFYIWGETFNNRYSVVSRSLPLGPFNHVRISTYYVFAGPGISEESEIAFFNPKKNRWVMLDGAGEPTEYREIVFHSNV